MQIVVKNDGQVPATARFDALQSSCFTFEGNMSHTITPKSYQAFDINFKPKTAQNESCMLTFQTMGNAYEQHKVLLQGEGYSENVTFEGLQNDELSLGDCIVGKAKSTTFSLANNGDRPIRFAWNAGDKEGFRFSPCEGHLRANGTKEIKVQFRSDATVQHD
jgi:hypothetical protein